MIVFEFEFDLYRKLLKHFERYVLVHCYHSGQVEFVNLQSIVFHAYCTQTHTHIHVHIDLQKQNMGVLITVFLGSFMYDVYANCLSLANLTPGVSQLQP